MFHINWVDTPVRKLPKFHLIFWGGILWKSTVSAEFWVIHRKLCGNYALPQNFHPRKLGKTGILCSISIHIRHVLKKTIKTHNFHFHFFLIGVLVGNFDLAPRPRIFTDPRPRPRPVPVFLRLFLSSKIAKWDLCNWAKNIKTNC